MTGISINSLKTSTVSVAIRTGSVRERDNKKVQVVHRLYLSGRRWDLGGGPANPRKTRAPRSVAAVTDADGRRRQRVVAFPPLHEHRGGVGLGLDI
ncbi:hypothetical protein SKAU_G00198760 [Synaphobranchus kaupii]|uniref:Uncharacterized protein n=1 Tax=Synaphobranchus kaupii TaxID=118154 RepID=A0A9Q1IVW7_SYNKA|nr:hypothetical protein SKAU_G00198760 [Synaphobranchus kaupii]